VTEADRSHDTIEQQRLTIAELQTPVIQVWDGILALPLVGSIDTARAQEMNEALLERIVATGSEIVLLDITGVTSDSISISGGRGQVSVGAGAGAVTALVTLAAQTAATTVLSVYDFRGSIGYATSSTLVTAAGDAGEVDLSDCWISVLKGGAGGQGTAYTG